MVGEDEHDPSASELPGPPVLRIRAERDGSYAVEHEGVPIVVERIDIDEPTLAKLSDEPRTVRV